MNEIVCVDSIVIVAVALIVTPLRSPLITTEPDPRTAGAVNVAVYVPLLLSVTALRVTDVADNVTVPCDDVMLLPPRSFIWTVTADVDAPLATIVLGDAEIVELTTDTAPTVLPTGIAKVAEVVDTRPGDENVNVYDVPINPANVNAE